MRPGQIRCALQSMQTLQPPPVIPQLNAADRRLTDPESRGDIAPSSLRRTNSKHLFPVELGAVAFLATKYRSVTDHIGYVVFACCPSQVDRIAAAQVPVAARVSGIMVWRRRRAVGEPADNAVCQRRF